MSEEESSPSNSRRLNTRSRRPSSSYISSTSALRSPPPSSQNRRNYTSSLFRDETEDCCLVSSSTADDDLVSFSSPEPTIRHNFEINRHSVESSRNNFESNRLSTTVENNRNSVDNSRNNFENNRLSASSVEINRNSIVDNIRNSFENNRHSSDFLRNIAENSRISESGRSTSEFVRNSVEISRNISESNRNSASNSFISDVNIRSQLISSNNENRRTNIELNVDSPRSSTSSHNSIINSSENLIRSSLATIPTIEISKTAAQNTSSFDAMCKNSISGSILPTLQNTLMLPPADSISTLPDNGPKYNFKSKIKKASSFERFSAIQATNQATTNLASNSTSTISNNSNSSENNNMNLTNSSSSSSVLSSNNSVNVTKPYHIKKLAAKLAHALLENNYEENSTNEPLLRKQLSTSPLNLELATSSKNLNSNLTSNSSSSNLNLTSKKIPLTPKQKLLQRMQSGELIIPDDEPIIISHEDNLIENSPQRLVPSVNPEQNQLLIAALQPNTSSNYLDDNLINERNYLSNLGSYELILPPSRGTLNEEFLSGGEGAGVSFCKNVSNIPSVSNIQNMGSSEESGNGVNIGGQILYDPYSYYNNYANLSFLSDLGHGTTTNGLNNLSNAQDELSLGFGGQSGAVCHGAGLEFGLNEIELGHSAQFLEGEEGSGKNIGFANDSTLRNLLMMDPFPTRAHVEESPERESDEGNCRYADSWISHPSHSNWNFVPPRPNINSINSINTINSINSMNNISSINGWGEQEEVMDMSLMDLPKNLDLKNPPYSVHGCRNANIEMSYNEDEDEMDENEPVNLIASNESLIENVFFTTTTSTISTTVGGGSGMNNLSVNQTTGGGFENEFLMPSLQENSHIDEKRIILIKKRSREETVKFKRVEIKDEGEVKINIILDKPVQPKSQASLPSCLTLIKTDSLKNNLINNSSNNSINNSANGTNFPPSVFTSRTRKICKNTKFGPVEGPLKRVYKSDFSSEKSSIFPILVMVDNVGLIYQLDRSDDDLCNWMKFVRKASNSSEQNLLISEEEGLLYFTSCREISGKTELKVGYGAEYALKYNLEYYVPITEKINENGEKETKKRKKESSENIVKYSCFECDGNFSTVEELNEHLERNHREKDGFRRPKKKAISKFYSSLKNLRNIKNDEQKVESSVSEAKNLADENSDKNKEKSCENDDKNGIIEAEEVPIVESSSGNLNLKPKFRCRICYKSFATENRLQKHSINHSDDYLKPIKCNLCSKRFFTNSALGGHLKVHAAGKCFECPLCNFSTHQLLALKEHVQSHKNKENGSFSCPHCSKTFSLYTLVRKHIRTFHGPLIYSCKVCTMKFPTGEKLKLHELKHSAFRAYLCSDCGRQFKRKDKLSEHARKAHSPQKNSENQKNDLQNSPNSPNSLTNDTADSKNLENCSKNQNESSINTSTTTKSEPCDNLPNSSISDSTNSKNSLLANGLIELSVQNVAKCKRERKIVSKLSVEELSKYTFSCSECRVGFLRRGMLVNHLLRRHPNTNPNDVAELKLPISRAAKHFYCPHCERVYKSSSKRKAHILKNHPGKSVPPQAKSKDIRSNVEVVGSTTGLEEGFKYNRSVNSEERKESVVGKIIYNAHSCSWCSRQYASRAKLLQHQRKAHFQMLPPEIQNPRPQKHRQSQNVAHLEEVGSSPPPSKNRSEEHGTNKDENIDKNCESDSGESNENMLGYLITTSNGSTVTNNDLENLPDFVFTLLPPPTNNSSSTPKSYTLCIPSGILANQGSGSYQISTNQGAGFQISTNERAGFQISTNNNMISSETSGGTTSHTN